MTGRRAPPRSEQASAFGRFLLSGGFNTLVTYLLYLALLQVLPYRISYTLSYVAGVALAYELNRVLVFKTRRSVRSAILTPLIYLGQYIVGLGVVWIVVSKMGLDARLAPLAAIAVTVPMTFLLSRLAFRETRSS